MLGLGPSALPAIRQSQFFRAAKLPMAALRALGPVRTGGGIAAVREQFLQCQETMALEEYNARQPVRSAMAPSSLPVAAPVAVNAAQWSLVHVRSEANEKHRIEGESVMVGRDRTCSIVLSHPAVSRRHARITLTGASWVLEDLKSANGTYVNNTSVERAKLKAGDVVRFGADPSCSYVLKEL